MKYLISILIILLGFCLTACNPGRISTQSPAQTTLPLATTPSVLMATTAVLPTNTETPSSPSQTPSQIPSPSLTATQTSTQTSAPTPIAPTPRPTATDDPFSNRLLPDLQTLPPTDLRLLYNADTGQALIRFTNSIWNSGPGKLELFGIRNQTNDKILVSQRVFAADPLIFDEYEVGKFIFFDEHDHWHLEQFATYELWSVNEMGSLEIIVSSGEKVSWCVIDESLAETDLPDEMISTQPNYTNCEGEIQGLSVGWIDIYESYLPRQWVKIASLEDGLYALVSTVNPDHLLYEEDFYNNTGIVYFEIRELRLNILEGPFLEHED